MRVRCSADRKRKWVGPGPKQKGRSRKDKTTNYTTTSVAMTSNKETFRGYCCRLVRADSETPAEPSTICGTIVKLNGLRLPLDCQQIHHLLPGLALRVKDIQTEYVLVTTHSLIPKASDLNLWKFPEEFIGAKRTLEKYVSGVVSCCGEESGFIIPGSTTALEHRGKKCNLGLNFTMLYLNEKFKQHYCAQYGNQPNPPCVNIKECKADIDKVCKHLHLPQASQCVLAQATDTSTEAALSIESSGSFEVITAVSPNGKVSMSAVGLNAIDDADLPQRNESATLRSKLELTQDIITFQRVKTVQCRGPMASHLSAGMPLVYMSTDDHRSSKLIGIQTGDSQALILSALFYLLQGNPAASLSLLVFTEMWHLWTYKWSHLLLPYLENHPAQLKLILEILVVLLERRQERKEHFLAVSSRDDLDTRLGFLKFLKVLFHPFDGQGKEAITQMTQEVCNQAGVDVENFLGEINGLCGSLSSIVEWCCDYKDVAQNPKIVLLMEDCFICANEMLNFQHDQDVVEKVLCTERFETLLTSLQKSCPQSSVIMSNLVAFHRKLHTPCRKKLAKITQELQSCKAELVLSEQDKEKFQAELDKVKIEKKELAEKCHILKTQHDAASNKCQKTMSMLKDSEKRQREVSCKNEELTAEIENVRKQLASERESKQVLETDAENIRKDSRLVEDDKRKLEEEKRKLTREKQKLEQENERLKDENKSLEIQNQKLIESGHELHRSNSDLSHQMYLIQRQRQRIHNSSSDSDVIAVRKTVSVQTVTPLQEHSDLHHRELQGIAPTTVRSVQATSDSHQNSSQN